jgi:hypothetical protein
MLNAQPRNTFHGVSMPLTPFTFGSPVIPSNLHGRRRELRRLVGRLLQQGQSSALVGEPRSGKTSLLHYIMSTEKRTELYGPAGGKLLFCYFDVLTLGEKFCPAQFWERALEPVRENAVKDTPLEAALRTCHLENYGNFVLERLFTRLQDGGFTLVILLDEFDALVEHTAFQQAEFYGGLRALASRYASLALVIASRQSLACLNRRTQDFSRNGSPFFNIMEEIFLGPLTEKECNELLASADEHFSAKDRRFLFSVTGGHPYLLQAAASALWEAYEDGKINAAERWKGAVDALYTQANSTLADIWRLWTPEMKKGFTILALDEFPVLLGEKQFDISALLKELPNYNPELRELKQRGFIREDTSLAGGWSVTAGILLWWLADEWIKVLRQQDDLSAWLGSQGLEGGLIKTGERKQLSAAAKSLGIMLKGGLSTFIQSAAEGFGKGLSGVK